VNPDVVASVHLFRAEDGGRQSSTPDNYLSCPLEVKNRYYDCRMLLFDVGRISPGMSAIVSIVFLDRESALTVFKEGVDFRIWEGKVIGTGRVKQVVRQQNDSER